MYFYTSKNGRFFHNYNKTVGVKNAQIRITTMLDDDCNLIVCDIKRMAGTELSKLSWTIENMIEYATLIGIKKIICNTNKVPACYLRKMGFETVDGCTLFNIY
jgi:hypothetical protein